VFDDPPMIRDGDGLWQSYGGPINTRLSAVIITSGLKPWDIARCRPVIYHNPWAVRPCREQFPGLAAEVPVGDEIHSVEGKPIWEIFGLSQEWPL